MTISVRRAEKADLEGVLAHLARAGLPLEGVEEHFGHFLVAEAGSELLGAIGMELYGSEALLRSAVVAPERRDLGVGTLLCDSLVAHAASLGVKRIVLLTTTAERFFSRRGFRTILPESVLGPLRTSSEFRGACPSNAVCMERRL